MNHPNLCQIHEIAEDGEQLFLVMELLEGQPLSDKLQTGPLSPAEALSVLLQTLEALDALHSQGLIH